jgi:hypothetical protein
MEAEELDLVTTDDLMHALFRRCRTGVITLMQNRDQETDARVYSWTGGEEHALGLCEAMSTRLRLMIESDFVEDNEIQDNSL